MSDLARQLLSELSTEFGRRSNQDFQSLEAGRNRAFQADESRLMKEFQADESEKQFEKEMDVLKENNESLFNRFVEEGNQTFRRDSLRFETELEKYKMMLAKALEDRKLNDKATAKKDSLDYDKFLKALEAQSTESNLNRDAEATSDSLNLDNAIKLAEIQTKPIYAEIEADRKKRESEEAKYKQLSQTTFRPSSTYNDVQGILNEKGGILGLGLNESEMYGQLMGVMPNLNKDVEQLVLNETPKTNRKRQKVTEIIKALYKKMNTSDYLDGGLLDGNNPKYRESIEDLEGLLLTLGEIGEDFDSEPKNNRIGAEGNYSNLFYEK